MPLKPRFIRRFSSDTTTDTRQSWLIDSALVLVIAIIPNLILAVHFHSLAPKYSDKGLIKNLLAPYAEVPAGHYVGWLGVNLAILGLLFTLRQLLMVPLKRIAQHLQQLFAAYSQEAQPPAPSPFHVGRLALDIGRFATFAVEHFRKHQEMSVALEQSRHVIAQFAMEQQAILNSTNREIAIQYQSVLAYANYLDDKITTNKLDPSLRYDLDDICESSFNLKLIAGALQMLSHEAPYTLTNVPLATLMQQTMLALAPTLDRRSMKLTTADVDLSVAARGNPETLAHILWMMLLGMIRYAANESILRIRCLHSRDGLQAIMSIVVSELSPMQMSERERGDYLARKLQHLTPHMFAETIRIHGNIQLAELLIKRIQGNVHVLPLTTTSCEICLVLPSAVIDKTC